MNKRINFISFILILGLIFGLKAAQAEPESVPQYEETLKGILKRGLYLLAQKRKEAAVPLRRSKRAPLGLPSHEAIFQLESLNESIILSIQGGSLFIEKRDLDRAEKMLKDAVRKDSSNPLAYLLLGDLSDYKGKQGEAADHYIKFWDRTQREKHLTEALFNAGEREIIAKHIQLKFKTYRMPPPTAKGLSRVPLLMDWNLRKDSFAKLIVTYLLPISILIGIPFLIFRHSFMGQTTIDTDRLLFTIYGALVVAYTVWLLHLFLDLPPLIEPIEWEILSIAGLGTIYAFFMNAWKRHAVKKKVLSDPAAKFCASCGKEILKVVVVCPFCNKPADR